LRNFVYLHAIDHGEPLPIGTQDANLLDVRFTDADSELFMTEDDDDAVPQDQDGERLCNEDEFRRRAAEIYTQYAGPLKKQFRWLPPNRFQPQLAKDLRTDSASLLAVLHRCGDWNAARDAKLAALIRLINRTHRGEKIIVFSQFTDTVRYLFRARVHQRLQENAEVVGTDEAFFEDEQNDQAMRDLFTEKAGILDGGADTEVDLGSYAFQIWKNAIDRDPSLQKMIPGVIELREEGRLCMIHEEEESQEPRIIRSLGLADPAGEAEV
jgi:hypothetical protein